MAKTPVTEFSGRRRREAPATSRRKKPATRPVGLTRERIVEAALQLVERETLAGFSTRKLGEALGCEAMSIYHHFQSKQHLIDALVAHAISTVEVPEPGPGLEQRLRRMVHSYRTMARRWPALYQLIAVHRLNMPEGVRLIERVLELIHAGTGGDWELTARQFRAIGYYLTGAALDETAGYAKGPSAAEPVSDDYIARECPHLAAVAPYFKPEQWDATFEYGLDALVRRAHEDAAARGASEATKPRPVAGKTSKKRR
jgi:AcrR family transcriptional regulator